MKLRITSDGTFLGTKVVNAETGEKVEMVKSVRWEHASAEDVPIATIEVYMPEVEVVMDKDCVSFIEVEATPLGSPYRVIRPAKRATKED